MSETAAWRTGEFAEWIENAERDELVNVLTSLTDGDRRRLSKEVAAAFRKVRSDFRIRVNLSLAILAICPWSEVKRANARFLLWDTSAEEHRAPDILRILRARKPDWIDDFVAQELGKDFSRWSLIRDLVREKLCTKPTSDNYVTTMVRTNLGRGWEKVPLRDRLLGDRALLDDEIWRIFEVDVVRGQLFPGDEASWRENHDSSWGPTLVSLAKEGAIDRRRLLRAAHETLLRGLQLKDTPFYLRLIDRLEPTSEERGELAEAYFELLRHRVDAVVRFAVEQCEALFNEGKLEPAVVVARISPALQRETKGPALAALKLIRRIAKKNRALASDVARVAVEALRHPSADVHEKALDLIEELGAPPELAAYVEGVAPSQRARAEKLASENKVSTPSAPAGDTREDFEAIVSRARSLDPQTRSLYAIDELLDAIGKREPPPRWFPSHRLPRLEASKAVEPVGDFTAMVDLMLAIMETQASAIDIERALDAFSRLAADPPADYRARTAALLKRTTQNATGVGDWSLVGTQIMGLVQKWLQGGSKTQLVNPVPERFLELRIDEIVARVRTKRAAPLLALPTHGAWIDPRVLVQRLRWYTETKTPIGERDLLQALLRLAPEHRSDALTAAEGLDCEEAPLVRWALGGEQEEQAKTLLGRLFGGDKKKKWPLWAAAARARDPFGSDDSLRDTPAANHAWGAEPVSWTWRVRTEKPQWGAPETFVDVESPIDNAKSPEWPLSLFADRGKRWIFGSVADVRFRQAIWPANPAPVFLAGINSIVDRLFRPASAYTTTATYFEPLLDPRVPMSMPAELALALALVAQDADARTMAVDAAIAVIGDGRLNGEEIGMIYARLFTVEGFLKLGRVADAVNAIAPASIVHQLACARLLEELLASMKPPLPRDVHHLLGAYREILAATNRSADPRIESLIASATGAGKSAKLCREIAGAKGTRTTPNEAYAMLLARRIEIAKT